MAFEQKLKQKLEFKLSPQQLQLLSFLQIPNILLESKLKEELEKNIVLEFEDNKIDEFKQEDTNNNELNNNEIEKNYDENTDDENHYNETETYPEIDDKRLNNIKNNEQLFDNLMNQLGFLKLNETELIIAKYIIGNIEEDGFLLRPINTMIDELLFKYNLEIEENKFKEILKKIQTFEPAGIGAQNLQESLLIQLNRNYSTSNNSWLLNGIKIIKNYFNEFLHKNYDALQKSLNINIDELTLIIDNLSKLNPKPSNAIKSNTITEIIVPDFIVTYENEKINIELTKEKIPKVKINNYYKNIQQKYEKESLKNKSYKEADNFIKEKIIQGEQLIQNIKLRENILLNTMEIIAEKQKDFFITGNISNLKPLILRDIAEPLNIGISTASRIINSKYVQTDYGLLSLKFFFGENFENEFGKEINSREIKDLINEIIANEDKSNPLTDEEIKQQLEEKGFIIVRRTISKYRQDMNINIAKMRRKL